MSRNKLSNWPTVAITGSALLASVLVCSVDAHIEAKGQKSLGADMEPGQVGILTSTASGNVTAIFAQVEADPNGAFMLAARPRLEQQHQALDRRGTALSSAPAFVFDFYEI